jgi:hypothetical protein
MAYRSLNDFFYRIVINSDNKYDRVLIKSTCLNRSWAACPFVRTGRP